MGERIVRSDKATDKVLGILGGMGPLASAEFLWTLYRWNLATPEQTMPRTVLLSDPSFPDRTEAILAGRTDVLVAPLESALRRLLDLGAERIVIACVTIHHALPLVPEDLRRRVISLIDLVVDEIEASPRLLLLLTTTGTEKARIFESHPRWPSVAGYVVRPDAEDQQRLHDWIYRVKAGESGEGSSGWLRDLPDRYGVHGMIFGCTELHLLLRHLPTDEVESGRILDPLLVAARRWPALFE